MRTKSKNDIMNLRASIKSVDPNLENIDDIKKKLVENKNLIKSYSNDLFVNKQHFNGQDVKILKTKINDYQNFADYISKNFYKIEKYQFGQNSENDAIIAEINTNMLKWLNDHEKWHQQITKKLSNNTGNYDMSKLFGIYKELISSIVVNSINLFNHNENKIVEKKIEKLETKLTEIANVKNIKNELSKLECENNMYQEKIIILEHQIKQVKKYHDYISGNEKYNQQITEIQQKIDDQLNQQKIYSQQGKENKK